MPQTTKIYGERQAEIDYLKSLLIMLVVAFHLAYFGDGHPYLKRFVYTFHMPAFLLISGYLMKADKPLRSFAKTMLWLAVPYLFMESGYLFMASVLPIRDHIDLSTDIFIYKLLFNPLGPYWYLHSLIIYGVFCHVAFKLSHDSPLPFLLFLALLLGTAAWVHLMSVSVALYLFLGAAVHKSPYTFLGIFTRAWWSWMALAILFFIPAAFNRISVGGLFIVYFSVSAALSVYPHIPPRAKAILLFLGRNTLPIYIFSPLFTICCKVLIPYLSFDSTRLLFLLLSLPTCIGGSLVVCKLFDLLHLSPYFFGRSRAMR